MFVSIVEVRKRFSGFDGIILWNFEYTGDNEIIEKDWHALCGLSFVVLM